MRKVIKILGILLSTALLLIVILPLTCSLLLSVPRFQRLAISTITGYISQRTGVDVSLRRVDLMAYNSVRLYDFCVNDLQKDTLLFVGYTEAELSDIGSIGKALTVESAKIRDAKLLLHDSPQHKDELNIQMVIERMFGKPKASDKSYLVKVNNAEISEFTFALEMQEKFNPLYGIDYNDMHFSDVTLRGRDITIDGDVVAAEIISFSGKEKSGFYLKDMNSQVYLSDGVLSFENSEIESYNSRFNINHLYLLGDDWDSFKDFNHNVNIDTRITGGPVAASDAAYFVPSLRGRQFTADNLDISVEGEVDSLDVNVDYLTLLDGTELSARAALVGAHEIDSMLYNVEVASLKSNAKDIDYILNQFTGGKLDHATYSTLSRVGGMDLQGNIDGDMTSMGLWGTLLTDVGALDLNITAAGFDQQNINYGLDVYTQNLALGQVVNSRSLGALSLEGHATGEIAAGVFNCDVDTNIERLQYKSYNYSRIGVNAEIKDGIYSGDINSKDKNIDLDIYGMADMRDSVGQYDVTVRLKHADLVALNLNHRDSISHLAAVAKISGSGNTLDDMNGGASIYNIDYQYDDKRLEATDISIVAQNSSNEKYIEMTSEYINALFRSRTSYNDIIPYLSNSMRRYLPLLYNDSKPLAPMGEQTASNPEEYSTLTLNLKDITPVVDAVLKDWEVAPDSKVSLMFNPFSERFSLSANSTYVGMDDFMAANIDISAGSRRDSMMLFASSEQMLVGHQPVDNFILMGGARDNKIELSTGFRNSEDKTSAMLSLDATLQPSELYGREVAINIRPSYLSRGKNTWNIEADRILADTARVEVDDFRIVNNHQRLDMRGMISRDDADSLHLDMKHFDLSILSPLVESVGYDITGEVNGDVTMRSLRSDVRVKANLDIDTLAVNGMTAPPLRANARWDASQNRAQVYITDKIQRDTLVRGYYVPSDMRYFATLQADSINLGLLDAPLTTVLVDTKGYANANLTLRGKGRKATLSGKVLVDDFRSTVDYTKVQYNIPRATFNVANNELSMVAADVFDSEGNKGRITVKVGLQQLSNISYMTRIIPNQMMVLNTTEQDNEQFFGRIFASGVATIQGDKKGVTMDITAKTERNSSFYMPLQSTATASSADFITFVERKPDTDKESLGIRNIRRQRQQIARDDSPNMDIAMSLEVTPDADFQLMIDPTVGDIIKGRGEGRLNININPKANLFEMYGDYSITEGDYLFTLQNIINKKFIIESGSTIQWTGDPVNALLNISAVYQLKTSLQPLVSDESTRAVPVDCIIYLGDRLTQPSVSFGIELPTADPEQNAMLVNMLNDQEAISRQFFYLMLANSFISDNQGVSSSIGVSTTAATGFELLTNQLSNWLSSSNYNVVIRYRPESTLTGDEVDFGFSKGLIDNRLLIELEGNYALDNKSAIDNGNISNFMGEAYITWLIDRAGTMKLRGFTQTIDRFDENQGLQENGIGVYYRENFDNLKDLRERIKERFTFKRREEDE